MVSPYRVLGIPADADERTIRAAFRQAAKRHHPDLNPQDRMATRRLRRLVRARDELLTPRRRFMRAGLAVLPRPRWQTLSKQANLVMIGGVLLITAFIIAQTHTLPPPMLVHEAIVFENAIESPDAEAAELKAMRDLQEIWPIRVRESSGSGQISKQMPQRSLGSTRRSGRSKQNSFQQAVAKATTTWKKLASRLQSLKRSGT